MPKLIRLSDNVGEAGARSEAIQWTENGTFDKVVGNRPMVGCSMLVGSVTARSYSNQDYWMTTPVVEILEETETYTKFRTENSVYEWYA